MGSKILEINARRTTFGPKLVKVHFALSPDDSTEFDRLLKVSLFIPLSLSVLNAYSRPDFPQTRISLRAMARRTLSQTSLTNSLKRTICSLT